MQTKIIAGIEVPENLYRNGMEGYRDTHPKVEIDVESPSFKLVDSIVGNKEHFQKSLRFCRELNLRIVLRDLQKLSKIRLHEGELLYAFIKHGFEYNSYLIPGCNSYGFQHDFKIKKTPYDKWLSSMKAYQAV